MHFRGLVVGCSFGFAALMSAETSLALQAPVNPEQAGSFVGKTITVLGTVRVTQGADKSVLMTFYKPDIHPLRIVMLHNRKHFQNISYLNGKRAVVTGLIQRKNGQLEILVASPADFSGG